MIFQEALDTIGGLSRTSKMPWYSWSLPAQECQTGGRLKKVKGSVCEKCYAFRGHYGFPMVREAQYRRLHALQHPSFVDAFIQVLSALQAVERRSYLYRGVLVQENRFRWHDAGDLQSLDHLIMVNEIANQTPQVRHWVPTKEYTIVGAFLGKYKRFAPNLTVRVSHPMMGETYHNGASPFGLPFSTVGVANAPMKCYARSNVKVNCMDCDHCWSKSIQSVDYERH